MIKINHKCFKLFLLIALIIVNNASFANDFDRALDAANKGDYETARKLWQPLADQGHSLAEYNIGYMNYHGHGGAKNYKEAIKWYTISALHGNNVARYTLGLIYESGNITVKDYKLAAAWYQLAAKEGYGKAQFNLGMLYLDDKVGITNYQEGLRLIRLAAENGQSKAQFNLGIFYKEGRFLIKNDFLAYIWITIASEDKAIINANAEKKLVSINLSSKQLADAEKIAVSCIQRKIISCGI